MNRKPAMQKKACNQQEDEHHAMMETQIDNNYLKGQTMKFKTNYNAVSKRTTPGGNKMTVPGLALTNTEHIKRAKLGLSEQTIKVLYDPEDLFPDIRSLDFVDQRILLKHARQQVQAIKKAGEEYRQKHAKETETARLKKEMELEAKILSGLTKKQSA